MSITNKDIMAYNKLMYKDPEEHEIEETEECHFKLSLDISFGKSKDIDEDKK